MRAADSGQQLMDLFVKELTRRLQEQAAELTAAELNVIAKVLNDNSVTFASVRRGEFGTFAQNVAEEQFPFDDTGAESYQ